MWLALVGALAHRIGTTTGRTTLYPIASSIMYAVLAAARRVTACWIRPSGRRRTGARAERSIVARAAT